MESKMLNLNKKLKLILKQRGQSVTELIVALALIAVVFAGSLAVLSNSFSNIGQEFLALKAHYLVVGGLEGIRSMRNENWNVLVDGTWHFIYDESDPNNKILTLINGSEIIDSGYTRSIVISGVRRDPATYKITENGLYPIDPDTKLIEVRVEWYYKGETRLDSEKIYLTNWQNV